MMIFPPAFRRTILVAVITKYVVGLASTKSKTTSGAGFGAPKNAWKIHETDHSEPVTRLVETLKAQKADISNVEIGINPETTYNRGIFACKNFKKGQIICKIPSDLALALSDPAKHGDDAPTIAHAGANLLTMYMNNTQWQFYTQTLPKSNANSETPDFLDDTELELLEFPRVIGRAKERRQQIESVAREQNIPIEDLRMATWLVSTRHFPLAVADTNDDAPEYDEKGQVITKGGERKFIPVMVPFIDMANHNSQPNAKLTIIDPAKDDAWFALEAIRPIPQGREITLAYGSGVDSTVEILLNYGFVDADNCIDTLMLKKGGEDCLNNLEAWTTTIEEDRAMMEMTSQDDSVLKKILSFRIKLKESYPRYEKN